MGGFDQVHAGEIRRRRQIAQELGDDLIVHRLAGDGGRAAILGEVGEPDPVGRRLGKVVHHADGPHAFASEVGDDLELGVERLLLVVEIGDVPHL